MHKLAIYDMDKTITHAPTWLGFLIGTARARARWRLALLPVAGLAAAAYAVKLIDRAGLKQFTHRLMLGRALPAAGATSAAARFADRIIASGVFAGGRGRVPPDR